MCATPSAPRTSPVEKAANLVLLPCLGSLEFPWTPPGSCLHRLLGACPLSWLAALNTASPGALTPLLTTDSLLLEG